MPSMNHGYDAVRESGQHTTQVPPSPRLPFLEPHDSTGDGPGSVEVQTCNPGATVTVATRNSTYVLVVRDPEARAITVTGGRWGDHPAEGHVEGSSINGIFLTEGRIEVGLSLDLEVDGRRVVTSRVQSITVS
jgi:hypothetical protein